MVAGPRNHPNVPNWPPQFEHSALDLFEGEAKLGDSLGSVFRAPYISVTGSPEVSFARLIAARKELALPTSGRLC